MSWIGKGIAAIVVKAARFLAWFYYSTIRVSGTDRIPAHGPVLLVANHANSLVDPVVLGLAMRRRVRYLAKGPLFEIPVVGTLARWLGMIPVWRTVDDRSKMRRNIRSLADAAEALANREAVGIFPEGKSHDLRTLEPMFAGTSRIILQALDAGTDDLVVLPVGINYGDKQLFRSSVWVQVGEPIPAAEFVASHDSAGKAKTALTDEIAERLRSVIIHLDDPEWEPFLEDLEILDPESENPDGDDLFSLRQRWAIAGALNHFRVEEPEKVESIGRALSAHHIRLARRGLRVRAVILRHTGWRRIAALMARSIQLCFGFVPVLCGILHNLVPVLAEHGIVRLIPQTGHTTIACSRLVVGTVVFGLWYAFMWWWMSLFFLPWVASFWAITMPFAGLYALRYVRALRVVLRRWWTEARMLVDRKFLNERREMQARIRRRIRSLSDRYAEIRPPLKPKKLPIYRRPGLRIGVIWGTTAAAAAILVFAGIRAGFREYTLSALTAPAFDLASLDEQTLAREISSDEEVLGTVLSTLQNVRREAQKVRAALGDEDQSFLDPSEADEIHRLMWTHLSYRNELLRLIWKYRAASSVDDPRLRLRASLLVLTSGSALYQSASILVSTFENVPAARRKLNEPDPAWEIPEDMFDTIAHNLGDRVNVRALAEELARYHSQSAQYRQHELVGSEPHARFHAAIGAVTVKSPGGSNLLVDMIEEIETMTGETIYEGQSLISTWLGNTRVRERKGGPRVTAGHLEEIRAVLRPGDILIERQDWFLSRALMPGYWAHAALYVGDADTVAALGLADHEWVAPRWNSFRNSRCDILEAVPAGVRMTTLDHCIGVADSAAILRPRLSETEIKDAIARAFRDVGKPYDFEFDFFTGDKIVCTELIYRAYEGKITFDLVDVLGRKTFPPTELARKCAVESGREDREFDLILFLDGHVIGPSARKRGPGAFARSVDRPALTWLNMPR